MKKVCETCDELVITQGNPNVHPYMCKIVERKILAPWKAQEWCPKTNPRKAIRKRHACYTQTSEKEEIFMNGLSFTKLPKYLEGLRGRDQKLTDFNIANLITATKERIKQGD